MAAQIMNFKDQLDQSLHDCSKPWTSILANLESKTGVNRLYIFVGIVAGLGLWLVFGFAGQIICNTIGFLYPAYISIHAIESPNKEDDTKWLIYWVVFAAFSLLEYFADFIVGFFPLYWLLKCMFFVWLMIPTEFNGSLIVYNRIIRPYFLKHHGGVDAAMCRMKDSASKLLEKEH